MKSLDFVTIKRLFLVWNIYDICIDNLKIKLSFPNMLCNQISIAQKITMLTTETFSEANIPTYFECYNQFILIYASQQTFS